jgi:hypothetical protein
LTGPAGAGKTTSVRLIAMEMGIDVIEWGEGVEEYSLGGGGGFGELLEDSACIHLRSFKIANRRFPSSLHSCLAIPSLPLHYRLDPRRSPPGLLDLG